ncbi:hypothetical protein HDU91_000271 [Kappamyces sp. JEL0680]|nr:hypothetical protein HDU91_000271 [Kappamyces sp. JEL0680]
MSDAELSAVSNFSISVPLYGSVTFLEPVDLLSASPTKNRSGIQQIAGEVVIISNQVVTVYPDDETKAPPGEGLNVPAIITLSSCWPKDKQTGAIIDSEGDPRFDKHLKKLKSMPDTTFIGFEVITGTWKFRVEHFSRYGLVDDDDDDDDERQTVPETPVLPRAVHLEEDLEEDVEDTFLKARPEKWSLVKEVVQIDEDVLASDESFDEESDLLGDEESDEDYEEDDEEHGDELDEEELASEEELAADSIDLPRNPLQDSMPTVQRIQVARNVQSMKATFFQSPAPTKPVEPTKPAFFSFTPEKRQVPDSDSQVPSFASRTEFSSLPVVPQGSPKKYVRQNDLLVGKVNLRQAVPYEKSVTFGTHTKTDASFYMGRTFRAGFGPSGSFTSLKSMSKILIGRLDITDKTLLQNSTLECVLANADVLLTTTEQGVDVLVNPHEDSGLAADGEHCPKAFLKSGFSFSSVLQFTSPVFSEKEIETWKLCVALWDALQYDFRNLGLDTEQLEAIDIALRKTSASQWLKEASESAVTAELAKATTGIDRVFVNLTGNRVGAAVQEAIKTKDFRLATILSQLASSLVSVASKDGMRHPHGVPGRSGMDTEVMGDLICQIKEWKDSGMLSRFDERYRAVWSLVAGAVENWDRSVLLPSLDWKRKFGLFLWYAGGGNITFAEAVQFYSDNLDTIGYPESCFDSSLWDLQYHLLLLHTYHDASSMESALNPLTHSASALDYRMAWVLGMLLFYVCNYRFKDSVSFALEDADVDMDANDGLAVELPTSTTLDTLTLHFVTQLEACGAWKWAIFVSFFLPSHASRESLVRQLLCKWYPEADDSGSFYPKETSDLPANSEDYIFLTDKLYVSPLWIHEARVSRGF